MTWSRPGVRGRITLAATAAVAIVLALAGVALVILLQRDLLAGVDGLALARAQDIVALSNGTLPAVLPAAQNDASLAQVLDGNGGVLAASGNIEGESALIRPNPGQREPQVGTLSGLPIGGAERFRVLQETTGPPTAPRTIVVALSLAPVDEAVQSARSLLIQVLPAALLLTALVTWLGVGRALVPVERIRRRVAAIGGGDLSKRVPLPTARDEVTRLAETMNAMLDRLETSAGRQYRFVADASHELRTPLANMQASLEVALARADLDLWQETGQDLQGEYDRMRRLVEDLLLLARLDGQIPLAHDEVDLDDVVHEEAERLRRHTEVTVHVVPLPALRVRGDGARLAQVVGNLADNAARHAAATVSLSLRRDGDWAVVRVADDGPGVPLEHHLRIFDRFTRLDGARARDSGGSGLGLAISREIAQAHDGTLKLLPEGAELGAVFELRLPLVATKESDPL